MIDNQQEANKLNTNVKKGATRTSTDARILSLNRLGQSAWRNIYQIEDNSIYQQISML